jgi:hypothetical protein
MDAGQRAVAETVARERAMAAFEPQPELGLPQTGTLVALRERRGPGRPPGARNRRAEDVAREVIERLGDPLVMLAALAMTPADELVAAGLPLAEALAEKRLAAIAVLPFLHQRKPLAVDLRNQQVVHLTISTGAEPSADSGESGCNGVVLDAAEIVENQRISGEADGPV